MTRSELFLVMVGGFATVAGGVMAAYLGFLQGIPGIGKTTFLYYILHILINLHSHTRTVSVPRHWICNPIICWQL